MRNKLACAVLLALILCCLQMALPGRAFACSCAVLPTVQAAVSDADAVFLGTVIRVTPVNQNASGGSYSLTPPSNEVIFSVSSAWKGALRPEVKVLTGTGGGDCGYGFSAGDTYLVYAYSRHPGSPVFVIGDLRVEIPLGTQQFGTSICTRTAPLTLAAQDLAQLGPGAQPAQTDLLGFVLDNLLAVIAGVVALLIVLVLYLLRRKRQRTFRLKP